MPANTKLPLDGEKTRATSSCLSCVAWADAALTLADAGLVGSGSVDECQQQ